jgi:solute carrier family 34 (sodium-dependent phosphate cotransporter)
MISLDLLGTSAKVLSGCRAAALFGDDTNPVAAVMVALLGTALLQSSSLTTSIIVSLTGTVISVEQGIYMVMGANIGTVSNWCLVDILFLCFSHNSFAFDCLQTATNSVVSLAQMNDRDQLERAFSGAAVNDLFNFLSVFVFFPIEVTTHMLARLTEASVKGVVTTKGEEWEVCTLFIFFIW